VKGARAKKGVYSGALAKRCAPAYPKGSALSPSKPEEWDLWRQALVEHLFKGIQLLFEHYKISRDDFVVGLFPLVVLLAIDHVPYFQQPNAQRRGAPVDRLGYLRLELELAAEKKPTDRGDRPARRRIADANGEDVEGIRKRLARARKDPFVRYLTLMSKYPDVISRKDLEEVARKMGHL
jgi:hypothetical protein